MTVTKAEIADNLVEKMGFSKGQAKHVVETIFEEMRQALERGESVKLSRFGNFDLRYKKARPGRNPKTGEEKMVSARTVVTFKSGQKLKARVQGLESGSEDEGSEDSED